MHPDVITWIGNLYTLAILILFLSVGDQALGHAHILPTGATIVCVALLVPYTIFALARPSGRQRIMLVLATNVTALSFFSAMAILALVLSTHPQAFWDEHAKWIMLLPYGLLVTVLATVLGYFWLNHLIFQSAAFLSLVAILGSILTDYLIPGTFAPLGTRPAGFSGNANFSALVAVCICASAISFTSETARYRIASTKAVLDYHPQGGLTLVDSVKNTLLFFITSLCIVLTMSRSGAIHLLSLYVFFSTYRVANSSKTFRSILHYTLVIPVLILAAAIGIMKTSKTSIIFEGNTRLMRMLHNQQIDDGSASSRFQAALDSLQLIEHAPLLGHGTGYARTMQELPHNLYLQQWINNGIIGILLFCGFLVALFVTFARRAYPRGQALTLIATTGSMFSHNLLDQRPFLILIGLALGYSLRSSSSLHIDLSHLERYIGSKDRTGHNPS